MNKQGTNGPKGTRDVLVLCYHAVSPRWKAALSVTPSTLDAQVTYLVGRGWRATTFSDAVTETACERVLAITFDDAFGSVMRYAAPILSRHGVPATVFAPSSFMEGHVSLDWPGVDHWQHTENADEMRAMDWDDLRGLADAGWEIGSHTCTHPRLTTLDPASLERELTESKAMCAERLGRECRSIAYPYGDINPAVIAAAVYAGYETGARLSSDLELAGPHSFPRVGIYSGDQWSRFRLKVADPVRRIRATRLYSQQHQRRAASSA